MKVKKLKLKKWVRLKFIIEIFEVYEDDWIEEELLFDSVDILCEILGGFLLNKGKKSRGVKKKWKFIIIIFFKIKFEFLDVMLYDESFFENSSVFLNDIVKEVVVIVVRK